MTVRRWTTAVAVGAIMTTAFVVVDARSAHALPSFARQNGVSCVSCHAKPSDVKQLATAAVAEEKRASENVAAPSLPPSRRFDAGLAIHTDSSSSRDARSEPDPDDMRLAIHAADARRALSGMTGFISLQRFNAQVGFANRVETAPTDTDRFDPAVWYRLGYAPANGGAGLSFGVFGDTGAMNNQPDVEAPTLRTFTSPRTVGLDAQVRGVVGGYALDLTAMYMSADDEETDARWTEGKINLTDGFSAAARLGLTRALSLTAAYRTYKGKDATGAVYGEKITSLGARLSLSDQTSLASWYTTYLDDQTGGVSDEGAFTLLFISNF